MISEQMVVDAFSNKVLNDPQYANRAPMAAMEQAKVTKVGARFGNRLLDIADHGEAAVDSVMSTPGRIEECATAVVEEAALRVVGTGMALVSSPASFTLALVNYQNITGDETIDIQIGDTLSTRISISNVLSMAKELPLGKPEEVPEFLDNLAQTLQQNSYLIDQGYVTILPDTNSVMFTMNKPGNANLSVTVHSGQYAPDITVRVSEGHDAAGAVQKWGQDVVDKLKGNEFSDKLKEAKKGFQDFFAKTKEAVRGANDWLTEEMMSLSAGTDKFLKSVDAVAYGAELLAGAASDAVTDTLCGGMHKLVSGPMDYAGFKRREELSTTFAQAKNVSRSLETSKMFNTMGAIAANPTPSSVVPSSVKGSAQINQSIHESRRANSELLTAMRSKNKQTTATLDILSGSMAQSMTHGRSYCAGPPVQLPPVSPEVAAEHQKVLQGLLDKGVTTNQGGAGASPLFRGKQWAGILKSLSNVQRK